MVAINGALLIILILEFKRSTDSDEGFRQVKEAEANEQHKSIISALGAAALSVTWVFELINFVAGNCGLVVESDFYTKFQKLDVQDGKKYRLLADHVTQACQAHDRRHCPWQASDSVCTTVLFVTLSQKKKSASRGFFLDCPQQT